jgi:MFS family permease
MKISPLTLGIGVSMTVGYGTMYYSFSLLAPEIAREFGWDKSFVFSIFSVALLVGALTAPIIGQWVDQHGARIVMSAGSIMASVVLALFSQIHSATELAILILAIECISLSVQYESGFTALAHIHGKAADVHITGVTLIAGFASTIFWPLIQFLLSHMGWRDVYLVLAAINIAFTLPVHLMIPAKSKVGGAPSKEPETPSQDKPAAHSYQSKTFEIMILLGIIFSTSSYIMSAMSASLPVLLADIGYSKGAIAWAGAMIGPAQVTSRLLNLNLGRVLSPTDTAIVASAAMGLGMFWLLVAGLWTILPVAILFGLTYGVGQGLSSIVKGLLPLTYFPVSHYGRITGKLSTVRLVLAAAAPVVTIFLIENFGARSAVTLLACVAAFGVLAILRLKKIRPDKSGL